MVKHMDAILDISRANRELNRCVGLPWTGIGRSLDLVWLCFGGDVSWRDDRGRLTEKPEYALHIQGAFRISEGDRLVLGSSDLYELAEGEPEDYENILEAVTLFDRNAAELNASNALSTVTGTSVTSLGDVRIDFESGLSLEVLNASSGRQETWRLLSFVDPDIGFVFPEDARPSGQESQELPS
jgi:hypothetical protein